MMMLDRRHRVLLAAALTLAVPGAAQRTAVVDPLAPTGAWSANMRGNAATPPMGWSSWNAFGTDIDEDKVLGTARALVSTGLAGLGYRYVNIDDGWWAKRRLSDGRLQVRTDKFPSARVGGPQETSLRPLTDRIHAMGLKAGLYTDIGRISCSQSHSADPTHLPKGNVRERQIGLTGHVDRDIPLFFSDWGFDYLKVDACGTDESSQQAWQKRGADFIAYKPMIVRDSVNQSDIPGIQTAYRAVADAIARARPNGDYILSLCAWGAANVRAWGKDIGNLVRTSNDILPMWSRMLHTFDSAAGRALYAHPGSWNDPDMLFVGHGDFDAKHLVEARSHFSLWAMINAPLLIGYDMRAAPPSLLAIWGNKDLVRANQDSGGHQAVIAYDSQDVQIFVKTLTGTDRKMVAIFNRGIAPVDVKLMAEHLKFAPSAPITLRDVWGKARPTAFTGIATLPVAPRETLVFEATGTRALTAGHYLSELPGRVNVARDGVVTPQADPTIHRGIDPWEGTNTGGSRPVYAGWGGAQVDQGPYGETIRLNSVPYQTGIGILANSRLEVRNDAEYRRFTARVGVDDNSANTKADVEFLVYADRRLVARSPRMRFGQAPVTLSAAIGSTRIVELVARQLNDPQRPASVAWADAALLR